MAGQLVLTTFVLCLCDPCPFLHMLASRVGLHPKFGDEQKSFGVIKGFSKIVFLAKQSTNR